MSKNKHRGAKKPPRPVPPTKFQVAKTAGTAMAQIPMAQMSDRQTMLVMPAAAREKPDFDFDSLAEGQPGVYSATFVLNRPGNDIFRDHIEPLHGNSLIKLSVPAPANAVELRFGDLGEFAEANSVLQMVAYRSPNGRLGRILTRIEADNFDHADRRAFGLINRWLSSISLIHDVGVVIDLVEVTEESTGIVRQHVGVVGKAEVLNYEIGFVYTPETRHWLALYREGHNATSVFYRYLCFYKIIEGVNAAVVGRARRPSQQAAPSAVLRFPDDLTYLQDADTAAHDLFRKYAGEPLTSFINEENSAARDAVAHASKVEGFVANPDSHDDFKTYKNLAIVAKYVAQELLREEVIAQGQRALEEEKQAGQEDVRAVIQRIMRSYDVPSDVLALTIKCMFDGWSEFQAAGMLFGWGTDAQADYAEGGKPREIVSRLRRLLDSRRAELAWWLAETDPTADQHRVPRLQGLGVNVTPDSVEIDFEYLAEPGYLRPWGFVNLGKTWYPADEPSFGPSRSLAVIRIGGDQLDAAEELRVSIAFLDQQGVTEIRRCLAQREDKANVPGGLPSLPEGAMVMQSMDFSRDGEGNWNPSTSRLEG